MALRGDSAEARVVKQTFYLRCIRECIRSGRIVRGRCGRLRPHTADNFHGNGIPRVVGGLAPASESNATSVLECGPKICERGLRVLEKHYPEARVDEVEALLEPVAGC